MDEQKTEEYFENINVGDTVAVKYGSEFIYGKFNGWGRKTGYGYIDFDGEDAGELIPKSRIYTEADAYRAMLDETIDSVFESTDEPPFM